MNQTTGIARRNDRIELNALRSAIALGSHTLLALILIGILPATGSAKGRCWTITFGDDADGDGGNHKFVFNDTGVRGYVVYMTSDPGQTKVEKAQQLMFEIDTTPPHGVQADLGDEQNQVLVCINDDNQQSSNLGGIFHDDTASGEQLHMLQSDDSNYSPMAVLNIEGVGVDRQDGEVAYALLGLAHDTPYPMVTTNGKSGAQIEADLVDAFNAKYLDSPRASLKAGMIALEGMPPSTTGLAYGTDDNGLTYSVKYGRRAHNYIMVPVLNGWGVTILALLILATSTAVLRRRRLRA